MKKSIIIVIVLVILGVIIWKLNGSSSSSTTAQPSDTAAPTPATTSAPVSETTKVNDKLSEFKNEELGFSVKYPSTWEKTAGDTGVSFTIPTGKETTNTIGKLESKILVSSGKCTFPPVTTIKDRAPLKNGDLNFNMISMANSVQGRNYFDRMYSLQRDNICYILSFSSITLSPASKGYKGSEATQMTNNNKAIVDAADAAFTTMVKSFAYVVGPAGQDETTANPAKH
jgi:hypothetical protein